MTDGPIRRSQLISPFGVGALTVNQSGISILTCGLDNWFKREDEVGDERNSDTDEFKVQEWRLERRLGVDYFMLPPDFRTKRSVFNSDNEPNLYLTVPFHRFPQWHVCQRKGCGKMHELNLETRGKKTCGEVMGGDCKGRLVQVPLVAICEKGHMQDFPWREWVHESNDGGTCGGRMSLHQTGKGGLAGLEIRCTCKAKRSLSGITQAYQNGETELSTKLAKGKDVYLCKGRMPWLGRDTADDCGQHLRGGLRSSSNLYIADVRSSIFIPRESEGASGELMAILNDPPFSTMFSILKSVEQIPDVGTVRGMGRELVQDYDDVTLKTAIDLIFSGHGTEESEEAVEPGDDDETAFRRIEHRVLSENQNKSMLKVKLAEMGEYEPWVSEYFSKVGLIEKLRETRAFVGFSRVFSDDGRSVGEKIDMLRKTAPRQQHRWVPAYVVHGEGIFIQFREDKLASWEAQARGVEERVAKLAQNYEKAAEARRFAQTNSITSRFLLLHSFAHLLMNRLTFECGYSTAALRERLYVSASPTAPMASVLIYTAAGDAEGTMGGLVRIAKPGYLEPVVRRALEEARWCSADPICMEIGSGAGQGPDSCNLAACHNCGLVPETACEYFNRFLDRAVVVGDPGGTVEGFFADL